MKTHPALGLAAALWLTAPAQAVAASVDLDDTVPGHPGVTYLDLLRQLAPDLELTDVGAAGHVARGLRHLAGKGFSGDPPDPVMISQLEAARLQGGGRPHIAVLADLGPPEGQVQSNTVLLLFDDAPRPRLLDAAAVGLDKDTALGAPDRVRIGPGDEALITHSEHFNSNQTYAGRLVVFIDHGRLRLLTQLSSLSDRGCGWERTEAPAFSARPDPGRAFWRLSVTVHEVMKVDRTADCGEERAPRPYLRTWHAEYRWDARRRTFAATASDLNRLDRADRARF